MKVIDLTHIISAGMPVYPGTEGPRISQATTIEAEGFAEKLITMYSHTGTHMDAPGHIVAGAKTLDQFEAGHFMGLAHLVDVSASRNGTIGLDVIEANAAAICGKAFVIFRSGWSALWGNEAYYRDFPVLSEAAALRLCDFNLRGIGLDMISVDRVDTEDFPIHHVLFNRGLVVVENLANLELLPPTFIFSAMPLRMPSSDGSPVRAVAVEL